MNWSSRREGDVLTNLQQSIESIQYAGNSRPGPISLGQPTPMHIYMSALFIYVAIYCVFLFPSDNSIVFYPIYMQVSVRWNTPNLPASSKLWLSCTLHRTNTLHIHLHFATLMFKLKYSFLLPVALMLIVEQCNGSINLLHIYIYIYTVIDVDGLNFS